MKFNKKVESKSRITLGGASSTLVDWSFISAILFVIRPESKCASTCVCWVGSSALITFRFPSGYIGVIKNVCTYAIGNGLLFLVEEIVNLLVLVLGSPGEILDEFCYLLHLYYY